MPYEIELSDRRAAEIIAAFNEREQIVKDTQQRLIEKDKYIASLVSARIEVSGRDPDAPRGSANITKNGDKFLLLISDPQGSAQ